MNIDLLDYLLMPLRHPNPRKRRRHTPIDLPGFRGEGDAVGPSSGIGGRWPNGVTLASEAWKIDGRVTTPLSWVGVSEWHQEVIKQIDVHADDESLRSGPAHL